MQCGNDTAFHKTIFELIINYCFWNFPLYMVLQISPWVGPELIVKIRTYENWIGWTVSAFHGIYSSKYSNYWNCIKEKLDWIVMKHCCGEWFLSDKAAAELDFMLGFWNHHGHIIEKLLQKSYIESFLDVGIKLICLITQIIIPTQKPSYKTSHDLKSCKSKVSAKQWLQSYWCW